MLCGSLFLPSFRLGEEDLREVVQGSLLGCGGEWGVGYGGGGKGGRMRIGMAA